MTINEVVEKIASKDLSDQELFELLKDFLSDKYDADGNIIPVTLEQAVPIEQMGKLLRRSRPKVWKLLQDFVNEQHRNCCGHKDLP